MSGCAPEASVMCGLPGAELFDLKALDLAGGVAFEFLLTQLDLADLLEGRELFVDLVHFLSSLSFVIDVIDSMHFVQKMM